MPLYEYRCSECGLQDPRIAAFFEDVATCVKCGGIMYRLDDPFAPTPKSQIGLWDEQDAKP